MPTLLASLRSGGRGRWAALLCVLALAFNLLGAVAYADARRDFSDPDLFVCHAASSESPAQQPADAGQAAPAWKCPLCTVHSAGLAVPLAAAPELAAVPFARLGLRLPPPDDAAVLLPAVLLPGGARAPPLPV